MRLTIVFLFIATTLFSQKQTGFSGRLIYSIETTDTALTDLFHARTMTIYTNDTLVRVENMTDQLGKQVAIRHLELQKAYLLLHTASGNFAIQTKFETDSVVESKYTYSKKWGKKKIAGFKAKKVLVQHPSFESPMEFYYLKKTPSKYIVGFENFPGLLVEYYIPSEDGILKYTLKSMEADPTNLDLYGIPSDYQKVTMTEFIDIMTKANEVTE